MSSGTMIENKAAFTIVIACATALGTSIWVSSVNTQTTMIVTAPASAPTAIL